MRLFLIIFFLFTAIAINAQGTNEPVTFSGDTYNMIVHKPSGYDANPAKNYPTICFLPGQGEVGTNPVDAYKYGPNWAIQQGWDGSVTLGDSTFECIVISIQRPTVAGSPGEIRRCVDTVLGRYRVDTSRLYITGLSLGGQTIIRSLTEQGLSDVNFWKYKRFAATVLLSQGDNISTNHYNNLYQYAEIQGRILTLIGEDDESSRIAAYDSTLIAMNNSVPGSANGREWNASEASSSPGVAGHGGWNVFYNEAHQSWDTLTIYQWMLGHSKRPWAAASSNTINTNSTSITLQGISRQYTWGSNGWGEYTRTWSKISGPSGGNILNPSADTTGITGLQEGTYVFRFTTQTQQGLTASTDVTVNVSDPVTYYYIKKVRGRAFKVKRTI